MKTKTKVAKIKKQIGSTFRVYRFSKALRIAASKARASKDQTVSTFVEQAVADELPGLVQDARVVFHGRHSGVKGPVRLPVSDATLATLKDASGVVGLPAALLLELALTRFSAGTAKRTRRAKAR